jgi:small subunit ribosomal protein S1
MDDSHLGSPNNQPSNQPNYDDTPPPAPDDSYWAALLNDAEISSSEIEANDDSTWTTYDQASSENIENSGQLPIDFTTDWNNAHTAFETDKIIQLDVIGYNRGGLLVKWGELRGFVPASQLVDFPSDYEVEATRNRLLADYVGQTLDLRIIELDQTKNRLILSERAAQCSAGARDEILHNLVPGDIVDGVVTNLCTFGAFVDLGGIEGLIHISELSWGRVGHPADILERGQQLKVHVLNIDPDEGRVVLSLKRMQDDPWADVEKRYQVGQIVSGEITNVVDFGAFVCIEEGLEGLIHISELAEGNFLHPYNVVQEGDHVTARILHIDGAGRRLGLSLRQATSTNHE